VIPIALTVTWSKLSRAAVFSGAIIGAILGMLAWMIGCWKIYGEINVANLAEPYSAVCSGLTGLLFSGVITVFVSLAKPANYDFVGTRAIAVYEDIERERSMFNDSVDGDVVPNETPYDEKKAAVAEDVRPVGAEPHQPRPAASGEELKRVFKRAAWYSLVLTLIVAIIVPLPMFFSHYIFSKAFYKFWVACMIIWVGMSGMFCIILPIWESRKEIGLIGRGVLYMISRRAPPAGDV